MTQETQITQTEPVAIEVDEDTREFISSFVSEGLDMLDQVEPQLDDILSENYTEIVNCVFRLFHSLKGLASFLNFNLIKTVTHEAESLLDLFRQGKAVPDASLVDVLYKATDFIRLSVNHVNQYMSDQGLDQKAAETVNLLKAIYSELTGGGIKEELSAAELEAFFDESVNADSLLNQEMVEKYCSESIELIEKTEKIILDLEKNPENLENLHTVYRNVHSLKGDSGFMGFGDIEQICMELESILDALVNGKQVMDSDLVSVVLHIMDLFRKNLNSCAVMPAKEAMSIPEKSELLDRLKSFERRIPGYKPLGEILIEMGEATPEGIEKALFAQENFKTQAISAAAIGEVPPTAAPQMVERKDIRVDTGKLDKLFDLVGELITTEVMVTNNPDLRDLDLPNFTKAAGLLTKICRELQEVSMSVRMMPLEGLFNRMKRLVRDLSKKSLKPIELIISGQETEMDKNIIEDISDPLVHILRNAIDHGIEKPDIRKSKGKKEAGTVHLRAEYEGNEIMIVIEDDGAGLNRERILAKAVQRELVREDPEKLSDKDVWNLIFEPGFSTAEKVTEISGRGVGMDVVRKNIEKLRGTIEIDSKDGMGTQFKLKIPLTLAIMDVMLVRIGATCYAIPILTICESFKTTCQAITLTMDGQELVRVREDVFSVIRMHEVFQKPPEHEKLVDGILIMVESRGKKACLFVDEIMGQQQTVIKGLSDYIGRVRGISGCMILNDGEIGLIIDIDGVLATIEKPV